MSLLEDILQVTVRGVSGTLTSYTQLPSGQFTKIDKDSIDEVLLYQLTENEAMQQPFRYLNECYGRSRQARRIQKSSADPAVSSVLADLEGLVVGYGAVSLQVDNFCVHGELIDYVRDIIAHFDVYSDYIGNVLQRALQDDTLLELLNGVFPTILRYLTEEIPNFDLNNSALYNNVLSVFELFLSFKPAAAIFTKIDKFLDSFDCPPQLLEKTTILGPILTLSPMIPNVAMRNYGDILGRSKQQTNIIHESLQTEHRVVLDRLFFIIDKIVRGSTNARTDLLTYFSHIVNKNHLRRGDHSDPTKLSSNAFMTNISLILIKFSQPFLDVSYTKLDKIDVNYFNNLSLLIDLSGETRMNSDFKEADRFYDENKKSGDMKPNFISDCFFLTLTYMHYGIGGTLLYDEKLSPQIKRLKEEIEKVRTVTQSNPLFGKFADLQLKRLEKTLNLTQALRDSIKGFFSNRTIQLEVFDFICGASTFLVRVVDSTHLYPSQPLKLPLIPDQVGVENVDNAEYLRANAPIPFKYYPEYIVEGLINYSLYISQYPSAPIFRNPRLHSFIEFGTMILRCPELISNPHLKGKLVQLFSVGAMPLMDGSLGFMMDIFMNDEMVSDCLLYALLDFYVIVEKTGSSSQFYDKFNSRYSISIILEQLYDKSTKFRNQLIWQAENNADFFVRFVARMLNDLTFLLDEGLGNLTEVHNISIELDRRALGNEPTRDGETSELEGRLASAERQAKSSCGLAEKSLRLFEIYTKDIPSAFTTNEIVGRLASMMDYNLVSLVGPKCRELKVKDPQKYSFDPKALLKTLATVYINLSGQDEFIAAIANDGRSFKVEYFQRAVHILANKTGLLSTEECEILLEVARKAEKRKTEDEEEDLEFGDAPEEFLDPLMYTLMKDPVTLPESKVNIDRSTIKAHLLSDSTDPFNRMPLKLEQVIPNTELKKKIEAYKANKRAERMKID